MNRAAIIIFLITVFCPVIEARAAGIFDFFRRDKEKTSADESPILPQVYIVKRGESLSSIAKKFDGEVSKWSLIYEANKNKINDPNRIGQGVELIIPLPQKEKVEISQIEPFYQEGKECISRGDYPAAIVKFDRVIELEKEFYPVYTAYAQEFIRQAREKIKEKEKAQMQAQNKKEEEMAREKEKEEKRLREAGRKKAEIEKKAKIESFYRAGKEYFQNKDYINAVYAFGEMLTLEPGNKNALRYYERCQQKIKKEETARLFEYRQKQALFKKQKQAALEEEAQEKIKEEEETKIQAKREKEEELAREKKEAQEEEKAQASEYTIGEEDVLYISVWQEEDLSQEVIVRPDGKISFPLAGDVPVLGLNFFQLKEELTKRLKAYVRYPIVSITLRKLGGKKVIILGEVNRSGVYSVTGKRSVLEAIALAGGFTPDAVSSSVILIRGGFESPEGRRLNLSRAVKGVDIKQNVTLQPEDIIYVPKKFIANVNYALNQILGPLVSGVSASSNMRSLQE